MAVTSKTAKSRLDFGAALDSALYIDSNARAKDESETSYDALDNQMPVNLDNQAPVNQEDLQDVHGEESVIVDEEVLISTESEKVAEIVPVAHSRRVGVSKQKDKITSPPSQKSNNTNDVFAALAKNERGYQKSVYLESDVYQFIHEKATTYNVNFSNIVNMLLRDAISNYTN
jgi:hypothetical protein